MNNGIDWGWTVLIVIVFMGLAATLVWDGFYNIPVAKERATQECIDRGFDHMVSFNRIGFFSKDPVGIKCDFVSRYKKNDININGNTSQPVMLTKGI